MFTLAGCAAWKRPVPILQKENTTTDRDRELRRVSTVDVAPEGGSPPCSVGRLGIRAITGRGPGGLTVDRRYLLGREDVCCFHVYCGYCSPSASQTPLTQIITVDVFSQKLCRHVHGAGTCRGRKEIQKK